MDDAWFYERLLDHGNAASYHARRCLSWACLPWGFRLTHHWRAIYWGDMSPRAQQCVHHFRPGRRTRVKHRRWYGYFNIPLASASSAGYQRAAALWYWSYWFSTRAQALFGKVPDIKSARITPWRVSHTVLVLSPDEWASPIWYWFTVLSSFSPSIRHF